MRVLSLFDGLGGARLAVQKAGLDPYLQVYVRVETDRYCNLVFQKNWVTPASSSFLNGFVGPDHVQYQTHLDVRNYSFDPKHTWPYGFDILIGGSPCQGFSRAGKGLGFKDDRSKLFWEFVRLLQQTKPETFIFENVATMNKVDKEIISGALGVNPVMINSSLVSGQERKRLYWTNISCLDQPLDRLIFADHIIEQGMCDETFYPSNERQYLWMSREDRDSTRFNPGYKSQANTVHRGNKIGTISAGTHGYASGFVEDGERCRNMTPEEWELLQTIPRGYTNKYGISNTQRYKMLGNSFTVDVIAHIIKQSSVYKNRKATYGNRE